MRKMFLRWINFRLQASGLELQDLRDLFRTERLVALTEAVLGEKVEGANPTPRLEGNHDDNISLCVHAIARKTSVEWGAEKVSHSRSNPRCACSLCVNVVDQGRAVEAAGLFGDSLLASGRIGPFDATRAAVCARLARAIGQSD